MSQSHGLSLKQEHPQSLQLKGISEAYLQKSKIRDSSSGCCDLSTLSVITLTANLLLLSQYNRNSYQISLSRKMCNYSVEGLFNFFKIPVTHFHRTDRFQDC